MNLSAALKIPQGSEIILSKLDHETNVKPWLFMAERLNLKVKWWVSEKPELKLTPENLKPLLSEKVKFVACTHVSNVLGGIAAGLSAWLAGALDATFWVSCIAAGCGGFAGTYLAQKLTGYT